MKEFSPNLSIKCEQIPENLQYSTSDKIFVVKHLWYHSKNRP